QDADRLVGHRAALREGRSDGPELGLQVAGPEAEDEAALGDDVDRRELLGEHDGVPLGQDDDARPETDARGRRRHVRESYRGIEKGRLGLGRRGWDTRRRQDDVLTRPDRIEADLLGGAGDAEHRLDVRGQAEVDAEEADLRAHRRGLWHGPGSAASFPPARDEATYSLPPASRGTSAPPLLDDVGGPMKGAVYVGDAKSLSLEQLQPNPPGPRDVTVEVGASGVCHSDLSIMRGYVPVPPGMVLGHEGAGRVVEVGGEVSRVQKGDRVIASFVPACGACWHCLREQTELCECEAEIGMAMRGARPDGSPYFCMTGLGTFAETMTVNESSVVKVDTDLPDAQLALTGCGVTTGVGAALNTAKVRPGSSVAVLGCGGVGQAVIQGARIAGAGRIIAIDPQELKRKTATKLGATDVIDPSK